MKNNEWYNLSLHEKVRLKRLRKYLDGLLDNIDDSEMDEYWNSYLKD